MWTFATVSHQMVPDCSLPGVEVHFQKLTTGGKHSAEQELSSSLGCPADSQKSLWVTPVLCFYCNVGGVFRPSPAACLSAASPSSYFLFLVEG